MGQAATSKTRTSLTSGTFHRRSRSSQVSSLGLEEDKGSPTGARSPTSSSASSSSFPALPISSSELIIDNAFGHQTRMMEETSLICGLSSVAALLCDITLHLDEDFCIGHANGVINEFFRSAVEGRSFLEIVSLADRAIIEKGFQDVSLSQSAILQAFLLCEEGVGTMASKVLIMGAMFNGSPVYTVGVRTEDINGLCMRSTQGEIDLSDPTDGALFNSMMDSESPMMAAPSISVVPPEPMSTTAMANYGNGFNMRNSVKSNASKNVSREASLQSRDLSFAYSSSNASSFASSSFSRLFARGNSPTRKTSATNTIASALSDISKSNSLAYARAHSKKACHVESQTDVQTDMEQQDMATQTDSTHIPNLEPSRRPPLQRPSPRSSRSSRSVSKTKGSDPQKPPSPNACDSGESTSNHSRSGSRSGSTSTINRSRSNDLVIPHFEATDASTIMVYVTDFSEHLNVYWDTTSCCAWHAIVHAIVDATFLLFKEKCRHASWLPSSGWQCHECFALNEVDEHDCVVCCSDRSPGK